MSQLSRYVVVLETACDPVLILSPGQDPFQSSAQEPLQLLQQTAVRVSRQVEEFAKTLDKFNAARDHSDQKLWEDAWQLLEQYSTIALSRKDHTASRTVQDRSQSQNRKSIGDTDAQIEKLQFESDLWILTKRLLVCDCPESADIARNSQQDGLSDLHRYSSNPDIWEAFLSSDVIAQEYECILDWLQERASLQSPRIDNVVSELMHKAERGDGTWSAGPLYTRDAIKKQKRARAWPMPLDPLDPGLRSSLVRQSDDKPLTTQLDPDAQSRQGADLQESDEYYEQAAWQACWELLRRGEKLDINREWWSERKEPWRSAVLRGPAQVKQEPSPWLRIINLATNLEWSERCNVLCKNNDGKYDYQNAVYAILCGSKNGAMKVCKTIDDHLFVIFNSLLIDRYKKYLLAYNHKLQDRSTTTYEPSSTSMEDVQRFLAYAQDADITKNDAHQPHKFIEAALVSKDFSKFFVQLGEAAAQVAHMTQQSAHLMLEDEKTQKNDSAQITAQDQDSIRLVAHLQLLLRSLGLLEAAYRDHEYVLENNIASYIGELQRQAKWTLIPLYAAKLSKSRQPQVLGAILIDVTDDRERDLQVRLMKQYKINVSEVVYGVFYLANFNAIQAFKSSNSRFRPAKVTEYVGAGTVKHIKIRSDFMGDEMTEEEETAVKSVEWYRFVDAEYWGRACWSFTTLYKIFLCNGRLSAARELVGRTALSKISLSAFSMNLVFADATEESERSGDVQMDEEEEEYRVHSASPRKRKAHRVEHPLARAGTSRGALAQKALIWKQLEQLILALDALERWSGWAEEVEA